jgi:hypothetical protein
MSGGKLTFVVVMLALAAAACAPAPEAAQAPVSAATRAQQPTAGRHIAVTHGFVLRLASGEIEATQQKHLAECVRLGCSVMSTRLDRANEDRVSARSSVRIAPDRYGALAAFIAAPPAKVISHSEIAEDNTIAVLDVDKRLESKSALRERLGAMLRDPSAKTVAELVAIEKELAQVQSEIETATAQREYLRTITETVRVDMSYSGTAVVVGGTDFSPVKRAIDGIGQTFAASIGSLIWFLAAAAPWLPLMAFAAWFIRRRVRRWKAERAAPG